MTLQERAEEEAQILVINADYPEMTESDFETAGQNAWMLDDQEEGNTFLKYYAASLEGIRADRA